MEEFIMNVMEFIENIKNYVDNEYVKYYIPFQTKRIIARDALERATDDMDGFVRLDHTMANMYFYMHLVHEYFGVEIEDIENDYDALMSIGFDLGDLVYEDVCESYKIFASEKKNLMYENSVEAQFAKISNSLVNAINGLYEKFGSVDMSNILPEGVNADELLELIKKYKQFLGVDVMWIEIASF
jgi:hypothetical protein